MNKIKVVDTITYVLIGIGLFATAVLGICFNYDIRFYYATILIILVSLALMMLISIAVKEAIELTYDSPRFHIVMYVFNMIGGVGLYYLVKYVNYYETFYYLYWLGAILFAFLPEIICIILEKKLKKKPDNKGPKFVVNRK